VPALPLSLETFYCSQNTIFSLPVLPSGLKSLGCSYNELTDLGLLPDSLQNLYCSYNQLSSLPVLPHTLNSLVCDHNQISILPLIPASLRNLNCANNQLTGLPVLPFTMYSLVINNNPNIRCLPRIDSLTTHHSDEIDISNARIKCLWNPIWYQTFPTLPMIDTLPLCSSSNPNACILTNGISELNNFSIVIYPNPVLDIVSIANVFREGKIRCTILDISGKEFSRQEISNNFSPEIKLTLPKLSPGFYFLIINDGEKNYSNKFIVE
jgi:Leucine-rich repeat (LRR) protein